MYTANNIDIVIYYIISIKPISYCHETALLSGLIRNGTRVKESDPMARVKGSRELK